MKRTLLATFTLLGGIFGAGFLGIPYVIREAGFTIGIIEIAVISTALLILVLLVNNFLFKTKEDHQFTGYAEKYFGKAGKIIMFFAFAVGLYTAMVAYMIGEGESLSYLFFGSAIHQFYLAIGFWAFLSILIYFGLRALEKGELIGVALVLVTVILIAIFYGYRINFENLGFSNINFIFVPIGVIFFALMNFSGLPTVKEIVKGDKKSMNRATIIAYITAFLTYALFTFVVFGFKGKESPEIATLALGSIFIILGVLSIFTSAFSTFIALRNTWLLDWKRSRLTGWLCTVIPPLIIFLILSEIGYTHFTKIIQVGVMISGGLTALFLIALIIKSKITDDKPVKVIETLRG